MAKKTHVAVIGAGAFGGWTALSLLRTGARVTVVDAWGPGNPRASSGGDTRIIRGTYGPAAIYTAMAARALEVWKECQFKWGRAVYHRTGVLWLASAADDLYETAALAALENAGLAYDKLSPEEAGRLYPQINLEGVRWAIYEPDAGYLSARVACELVLKDLIRQGVDFRLAQARPGPIRGGSMEGITLSDGETLVADQYVFACGPWLGRLFPDLLEKLILPTRQEVFFFGRPAGDSRFLESDLPVWVDRGDAFMYGIPGSESTGFKVGDDTRGPRFDPTNGDRVPSNEALEVVRRYLAYRFPDLASAPVVKSLVCQYENTPDLNFIIDRHPEAHNVSIVGGGSGHGFKHGPVVGEIACDLTLRDRQPDPLFSLSRFS
ncbi:MAG TPA: FAD-dependent oxidoreductase [Blastocatellia bacterium]